jgi:hypothetical protein
MKRIIKVKMSGNAIREVEAQVTSGLGVHRSSGKGKEWVVTHIASGLKACGYGFDLKRRAMGFAAEFNAAFDSTLDERALLTAMRQGPDVREMIKKWEVA